MRRARSLRLSPPPRAPAAAVAGPCAVALVVAVSLVAPAAAQPPAQAPGTLVIVHALLRDGDGREVRDATVVAQAGRIASVTAGGPIPAGAVPIDAGGRVLTPGLIATLTPLGLVEISLEPETADLELEAADADAIRAAFSAADGYNPRSTLVPVARLGGVTSALCAPVGGLVSGTSAWVDLDGDRPSEAIVRDAVALHASLDERGVQSAGGALPAALGRLRELLDDARLYGRSRAAFDRRALREMHVSRLDLERLQEVLSGRMPLVVRVSRAADILRVLELAARERIRVVLAGAEEAWRVADRLGEAQVPVVLGPGSNLPAGFSRLGSRYDNAAILARAGVPIVLTSPGAHEVRNLRHEAGLAVAHGLDPDVALRAVTLEPARVFGLDADYGTVAPGRVANMVLWDGDPFEVTSAASRVIVRGRDVPMRSRQTELLERYRDLGAVRRGAASPGLP